MNSPIFRDPETCDAAHQAACVQRVTTLGTGLSDSSTSWSRSQLYGRAAALKRLSGTVWERSEFAVSSYTMMLRFGHWLGRLGISANALTYASLAFAAVGCFAAARGYFWGAALAVSFGGLCDALDGVVARTTGSVSRYGALLDSTIDRVSDALPLLGIVLFHAPFPLLATLPALALLAAMVIPYARARAEALGAQLPSLFMRRPERIALLLLGLAAGGHHVAPGQPAPWLLLTMGMLAGLNLTGAIVVLRAARRALEASGGMRRPTPRP